jgi:3-hydroxyacyl-CoA dehydrogenase
VKIIGDAIKLGTDKRFKGLVIGNDSDTFSAGADLRLLREAAQPTQRNWTQINDAIKDGQRAMQGLKFARFPVVSALAGKALGGGCELLLHSDAIQAHANSFPGLVEPAVGLVPSWGGCTQMLMRHSFPVVRHVPKVFQNIARCRVANSIDEAREMHILRAGDGITMNRERVLSDAKARALELVRAGYEPPVPRTDIPAPGEALLATLRMGVHMMRQGGYITDYEVKLGTKIAEVLCGGNVTPGTPVSEQYILDLEREGFKSLCGEKKTQERIQYTLKTGKTLRN